MGGWHNLSLLITCQVAPSGMIYIRETLENMYWSWIPSNVWKHNEDMENVEVINEPATSMIANTQLVSTSLASTQLASTALPLNDI